MKLHWTDFYNDGYKISGFLNLNNLPISFFPQIYWDTIDMQHCVSLRCTMCWFDTFVYCKMITMIALANTCVTSHNYHFFFMVRIFKVYSLISFPVYNTELLTIVTTPYLRSPECSPLLTGSLCHLTSISPFLHHLPTPLPQPLVTTILFFVSRSSGFLDST